MLLQNPLATFFSHTQLHTGVSRQCIAKCFHSSLPFHGLLAQFSAETRGRRLIFGKKLLKEGGARKTLVRIDVAADNFDVCQPIKSRVPPQAQREGGLLSFRALLKLCLAWIRSNFQVFPLTRLTAGGTEGKGLDGQEGAPQALQHRSAETEQGPLARARVEAMSQGDTQRPLGLRRGDSEPQARRTQSTGGG